MKRFEILLKSDMCVSDGDSFGSVIDTDVCYDRYGIPVIKGKSLKGCLRSIAEELSEYGVFKSDFVNDIFGAPGQAREGRLLVCDAFPEKYDLYKDDILGMKERPSSDRIISFFSYVRSQTAVNEDGTAKRNSLRSIRVIKKDLKFICDYEISSGSDYEYECLEKCIYLLRRIGMNKTRGLGEIKCQPCSETQNKSSGKIIDNNYTVLNYTIETVSPVIPSKENENLDYIPGSTFEGLCFRKLGKDTMNSYIDGGLRFSNAFLSIDGLRFSTAPAFLAKQKKAVFDSDNRMKLYIFDTETCDNATPPAMPVKSMSMYIDDDFSKIYSASPDSEINTHHKLSGDNPGIVEGKNLYNLSSLCAGQCFSGKVYGTPEMLKKIYESFGGESEINIGYYRNSGYGRCRLILALDKTEQSSKITDTVALCLNSPAVLYDDKAVLSASADVFSEYIKEMFADIGIAVAEVIHKYLRYTTVGGYNVSWNMNKQRFQAFAPGTVFVVKLESKTDISRLNNISIGERTTEGFGELRIFDYNDIIRSADSVSLVRYEKAEKTPEHKGGELTDYINFRKETEYLKQTAISKVSEFEKSINPTQVGRLMLMCMENSDYSSFIKTVEKITDNKRKERALAFLELSDDKIKDMIMHDSKHYKTYYRTLLTEAKYKLRVNIDVKAKEGE